jgi:hypothetical protein
VHRVAVGDRLPVPAGSGVLLDTSERLGHSRSDVLARPAAPSSVVNGVLARKAAFVFMRVGP